MTAEQMTALWTQIDRTAHERDARVIFRTAGSESPLPKKLPATLLSGWRYLEEESKQFHARDRSSIYGGFHVYARQEVS
jgi:S-adenosylmethionine-diacylglycerol 3-amino-3-carboxypropyl transferase